MNHHSTLMNFKSIHSMATAAVLLLSSGLTAHAQNSADVIVYGSTPGGFCAAIAAAREGATVILLEPTDHVGGMNTGGLSFSDSNQMYRDTLMGLFHEWHLRIQEDYESRGVNLSYDVYNKDQTRWAYEPHVATRVTDAMLAEAGVTVLTDRYLQSVNMTGARITELVTDNGSFTGRVFIDGSYEGDLMAAAGVSWTIGREGTADYGESRAGKVYPKDLMNINGFDDDENPLPLITATDAGPVADGDDNIMTYSFRLSMTDQLDNKVAMPAPANYDPDRFEVVRRYVLAHGASSAGFALYAVPGNKRDGNNSIWRQFSLGLVGGGKGWATADEAGRAAIFEAHKQYTLEFYHFLTTDTVFTQAQRDNYAQWGLCADEFTAFGNFPPQLYVRESRRMQGMYVLTENDIISNQAKSDPIAISSFPIDSHDCQRVVLPDGTVINEGTIFTVHPPGNPRGYPYHVPYRSILPQPAECDNLLVPVALSCTHVGISSLRIEGAWMVIGQGAGVAGAMAAKRDIAVQDLPYEDLAPRLLAQGQILALPDAYAGSEPPVPGSNVLVDDPAAELAGTWASSINRTPYVGAGYRYAGASGVANDGSATATFRFTAPEAGDYQIEMAYSPHSTRAANVPVTIASGSNTANLTVNQQTSRSGTYRVIGQTTLVADQETVITVGTAGTTGFVILDAIRLVLLDGETDSNSPMQINTVENGIASISHSFDPSLVAGKWQWSKDLVNFHGNGETDAEGTRVDFFDQKNVPAEGTHTLSVFMSGTPTETLFVKVAE